MKNLRRIVPETVMMCLFYLIILIAMIVSVSLDAWGTAGNGLAIPDRWLWVPATIFMVASLCQMIFFLVRKGNAGYGQVVFTILKFLAVFAVEGIIDLALDPVWYFTFQEDRVYFAMVIIFLAALILAAAAEIFGNLRLKKISANTDS